MRLCYLIAFLFNIIKIVSAKNTIFDQVLSNLSEYDFFEKLIKISLPRTRDFRGYSDKSFDGRGNYTLGIKEHIIFPEIDFDKIDRIKGLDICITTSAKNNEEAMELFKQFNFPFK